MSYRLLFLFLIAPYLLSLANFISYSTAHAIAHSSPYNKSDKGAD
jgi:hypothetical protein